MIGKVRQRDDRKQDGHDARDRTIRGALAISVMSVVGAKAENICSQRVFRVLTDAVEKGVDERSEQ